MPCSSLTNLQRFATPTLGNPDLWSYLKSKKVQNLVYFIGCITIYVLLQCTDACVYLCLSMCVCICLCMCVCDYRAWLIQMRERGGYHRETRHSESMHAFVSYSPYFNELGLSLQCCTLQQLFTRDKCDNNPLLQPSRLPTTHTHLYINILPKTSRTKPADEVRPSWF